LGNINVQRPQIDLQLKDGLREAATPKIISDDDPTAENTD